MNVEIVKEIPFSELEQKIRSVPLMQKNEDGSAIRVYQNARISFREMAPEEINPTTFYVLRKNLDFQRELRGQLLAKNKVDTLHLKAAYEIRNENDEFWTIMPPVVEVQTRHIRYVPQQGELDYPDTVPVCVPVVNDGAHRVYLAREIGETFTAAHILGADDKFPFYAHPNDWDRVKMVDTVPPKNEKKFYSRENCYALYRDFGVLGCGAPRKAGQ